MKEIMLLGIWVCIIILFVYWLLITRSKQSFIRIFLIIFSFLIIFLIYHTYFWINREEISCYMYGTCFYSSDNYKLQFHKDFSEIKLKVKNDLQEKNIGKSLIDIYGGESIFLNKYARLIFQNMILKEIKEDDYLFELNRCKIFNFDNNNCYTYFSNDGLNKLMIRE